MSKSAFERFAHKDAACKTEAFWKNINSGKRSANGPKILLSHATVLPLKILFGEVVIKYVCMYAFHVKTSQSAKN